MPTPNLLDQVDAEHQQTANTSPQPSTPMSQPAGTSSGNLLDQVDAEYTKTSDSGNGGGNNQPPVVNPLPHTPMPPEVTPAQYEKMTPDQRSAYDSQVR